MMNDEEATANNTLALPVLCWFIYKFDEKTIANIAKSEIGNAKGTASLIENKKGIAPSPE